MALILALALQVAAASPNIVGFSCHGYGEKKPSKWLNISVENAVWQSAEDGQWYKIYRIAPAEIWLTSETDHNLTIDRRSLILTERALIGPAKQLFQSQWACTMGPPIDITAGRQF